MAFLQKIQQLFVRPAAGATAPGGILQPHIVGNDHQRRRIGGCFDQGFDAVIGALAGGGEFNVQAMASLRAREISRGVPSIENDRDSCIGVERLGEKG